MTEEEKKFDGLDETTQVVLAGAVVPLNDATLMHGIILVHPELPPFKLFFNIDAEKKTVTDYRFEMIARQNEKIQRFVVDIVSDAQPVSPEKSALVVPENKLIMPGG